jgi:hypothetical protein
MHELWRWIYTWKRSQFFQCLASSVSKCRLIFSSFWEYSRVIIFANSSVLIHNWVNFIAINNTDPYTLSFPLHLSFSISSMSWPLENKIAYNFTLSSQTQLRLLGIHIVSWVYLNLRKKKHPLFSLRDFKL